MPKIIELAGEYKKKDFVDLIEKDVTYCFSNLSTKRIKQIRKREFRTSSLPFCPILEFLKEPQEESYEKSHYVSTGTAIHETIQSWYSVVDTVKDKVWGNWKCTGCQRIVKHRFQPKKLCECEHKSSTTAFHRGWPKHWTYDEVEYNYFGLSGHIDMIRFPEPDWAFVQDIKTSEIEVKRARYNWKQDKVSSPTYVAQIRTYCTVLDLSLGLPIKGWALSNVERGRPVKSMKDLHPQMASWSRENSLKWDKHLKRAIKNNELLIKLEIAVIKKDTERANRYLQKIIKNRPCTSPEEYKAFMGYKFYGEQKCGLCKECFSSSQRVLERIQLELEKKG